MRVLVVGSGGREHALAWKLSQECEVFATPGNPGIAEQAECFNVRTEDAAGLVDLCGRLNIDLVVFGPEAPLIAGLGGLLRQQGLNVFGPDAGPAQLEGSKAFSKDLMAEAGVPTARYGTFRELAPATEFARRLFDEGGAAVVKASGAALGKGVVVCDSLSQAEESLKSMLEEKNFGVAGETVVVEERIDGREFSLLTICSESGYWSLPAAQDHKRAFDGDRGPNTGGMGAFSPVDWVSESMVRHAEETIVAPVLAHLRSRGINYRGILFSGLMVANGRPYCLEYNVRFGDPETECVLPLLGSGFAAALMASAAGATIPPIDVSDQASVTVVLASDGYPNAYTKGKPIRIHSLPPDVLAFHAGTTSEGGNLVSSGGRVLAVTGLGPDLVQARKAAYEGVSMIDFEGKFFRTDIGASAMAVER